MSRMSASALTQLRIRHFKLIKSLVSVGSLHKAAEALMKLVEVILARDERERSSAICFGVSGSSMATNS